jgi:hypothetical protein
MRVVLFASDVFARATRGETQMGFKLSEDFQIPMSKCPECGHILDAANCVSDGRPPAAPEPGDFTVCLNCGHLLVFDDNLGTREPNVEEAREIAGDRRVLAIQKARGAVMKKTDHDHE